MDPHHRPQALQQACQGGRVVHLRAPLLRARRHSHDLHPQTDLAIPQLHRQLHHPDGQGNQDFIAKNINFKKSATDIGYGLRPTHDLEKAASSNGYPGEDGKPKGDTGKSEAISFDDFKKFVADYTADKVAKLSGVSEKDPQGPGGALRRPQGQDHVVLDHGLQPAYPRHLGQQPGL